LRELEHPNIVRLLEIINEENCLILVFEFCDLDLRAYLDKCYGVMQPSLIKIFLRQLLEGLQYCHDMHILHRDIKPQNLLINTDSMDLKIADFGLARAFTVPHRTFSPEVVTLWYRPPDVLMGATNYSTPIDMWGVGCVFAEMVTGNPLFAGNSPETQLTKIFRILGTPNEEDYPEIIDLPGWRDFKIYKAKSLRKFIIGLPDPGYDVLKKFLKYNPKERISCREALQHEYFED